MTKKIALFIVCFLFLLLIPLLKASIVPVPNSLAECLVVEKKVVDIIDAGSYDIRFVLEDDNHIYYINRGLESGLELEEMKEELIGQVVTFYYPDHSSIMDPSNNSRHLSQVNYNDQIIYSEIGSVISSKNYSD